MKSLFIFLWSVAVAIGQTANPPSGTNSRQEEYDKHWAMMTHLPIAQIREMRIAVGIGDDAVRHIQSVDMSMLKARKQVLLVLPGKAPCIAVVEQTARGYSQIWSLAEVPRTGPENEGISNGELLSNGKLCGPPGPRAQFTPEGRIVVEVRAYNYPSQAIIPSRTYQYSWDGSAYSPVKE